MAFARLADTLKLTTSNLLPSAPQGPLATTYNDIVSLVFSFLREGHAAALGRTCKRFNAFYLYTSPLALGFSQLYSNLKEPALELAIETDARELTAAELLLNNGSSTPSSAKLNADEKLQQFFENFQKSVTVLKPEFLHENFETFSHFAQEMLRSTFKEIAGGGAMSPLLSAKLSGVLRNFNINLFRQMVESYANLPLEEITIDSFQAQVKLIRKVFYMKNMSEIESELPKAIMKSHSASEFNAIRQELANLDSPQFAEGKAALETKLLVEKYDLLAELNELPKASQAQEKAAEEKKQALIQRNKALMSLYTAFKELGDLSSLNDSEMVIKQVSAFLKAPPGNTAPDAIARLQTLLADFQEKAKILAEKRKPHEQYTRFDEIAQYLPGSTTLCGGELFDLDKQLQPEALNAAVGNEMQKISSFYEEIGTAVDESQEYSRSQALHIIMTGFAEAQKR